MNNGTIVTYKDLEKMLAGYVGVVVGRVKDKPGRVLVCWNGTHYSTEESASDLKTL